MSASARRLPDLKTPPGPAYRAAGSEDPAYCTAGSNDPAYCTAGSKDPAYRAPRSEDPAYRAAGLKTRTAKEPTQSGRPASNVDVTAAVPLYNMSL